MNKLIEVSETTIQGAGRLLAWFGKLLCPDTGQQVVKQAISVLIERSRVAERNHRNHDHRIAALERKVTLLHGVLIGVVLVRILHGPL